jgi:hypothetical protein
VVDECWDGECEISWRCESDEVEGCHEVVRAATTFSGINDCRFNVVDHPEATMKWQEGQRQEWKERGKMTVAGRIMWQESLLIQTKMEVAMKD